MGNVDAGVDASGSRSMLVNNVDCAAAVSALSRALPSARCPLSAHEFLIRLFIYCLGALLPLAAQLASTDCVASGLIRSSRLDFHMYML